MDLTQLVLSRYSTKAFDPARKISGAVMESVRALLRNCPSSVNSQPWHFVIAASEVGKARIARATGGPYAYNGPKIQNASHVVVLCAKRDLDDAAVAERVAQEMRDGRFAEAADAEKQRASKAFYVSLHRDTRHDLPHWLEKQTYIALGSLLLGAAALGLAACPMEGFDPDVLAQELGLAARGLRPAVIVALGYASLDDWNAKLPKSRLPADVLFTEL